MRKGFVLFLFLPFLTLGQARYFVYLKDKAGSSGLAPQTFLSERSLQRRAAQKISLTDQDLPVSSAYLDEIRAAGFRIIGKSKWLNAVLVEGESSRMNTLKSLPFVNGIEGNADIRGDISMGQYARLRSKFTSPITPVDYGSSATQLRMLGADTMHTNGYRGTGVLIAVMDAGFPNVNTADAFTHLRNGGKIRHTWNYVYDTPDVYRDDTHGTHVLSIMAGYIPGKLSGTAPEADVALYITEDAIDANESKIEEVYWVLAAEHADSLGADVLNTSLGYYEFTDPSQDYTYEQMDGKTTISARGADHASRVGMVVVVSAGNEGNTSWRYISTPADAEYVIAVGAVNANRQKVGFSSFGPSADGRIKPEVCAMGSSTVLSQSGSTVSTGSGTSYSGPLIAGFMAGLRQQFPTLTALELREILIRSADRARTPDNSYGYGIPSYSRALKVAYSNYDVLLGKEPAEMQIITYPNPLSFPQGFSIRVGDEVLPDSQKISVTDSRGRLIRSDIEKSRLNPEQLADGLYYITVIHSGKRYSGKLVIKR
ncbi:MAG: S8 family serine peptidase [Leadbetterella sp.]|nr:S8 family serine peptidase [Leadbetterella sp.]